MSGQRTPPPPLMTQRTAIVLILALLAGGVIGLCTFLSNQNPADAFRNGLIAAGAAVLGFNQLLD